MNISTIPPNFCILLANPIQERQSFVSGITDMVQVDTFEIYNVYVKMVETAVPTGLSEPRVNGYAERAYDICFSFMRILI